MQTSFLLYKTENNDIKVDVRLENETLWLNQKQMAELFATERSVITKHIKNILADEELESSTCAKIAQVRQEGSREVKRNIDFYNLDMVIAVGYRVNSKQATRFRIWATNVLKEYIVKGFAMNDELLKNAGGGSYFEELLARIRDIRSSEKVFWRKVLDIYATSIDYDPSSESSKQLFKTIQNKMHWATHGHTVAEVVYQRADSSKTHMGMTNFKGSTPSKQESSIAKNYLNEEELNVLNRIVTAYIEVAEIQALNQKPMYMKDWITRLDDFLTMTGKEILTHAGKISHEQAMEKANKAYMKYREKTNNELSSVEKDFFEHLDSTVKKLK